MGGFGPQFSAPQMGGGPSPLLLGLLSALASLPKQNEERKAAKADTDYKAAQTKQISAQSDPNSPVNQERALQNQLTQQQLTQGATAMQQQQRTEAQGQWKELGQRVMVNPAWANSPQIKAQLEGLATKLGYPSPYNEDGSFNHNAFLNPLASIPTDASGEKAREFLLAQPPGATRVNAARSMGLSLTDEEANAQSSFTAKAQNDITRSAQQGIHYANADKTSADRAAALRVMQIAEAHKFDAQGALEKQKADNYHQVIANQTTRANAAMKNADAHLLSAKASVERAGKSMRSNQGLSSRFYSLALGDADHAAHALQTFDEAYATAQANGADDNTLQQISARRGAAQSTLDEARSQLKLLNAELGGNAGYSHGVSSASGGTQTTVTNAGGGGNKGGGQFKAGQTYTDAQGRKARYNADGSWTPQ